VSVTLTHAEAYQPNDLVMAAKLPSPQVGDIQFLTLGTGFSSLRPSSIGGGTDRVGAFTKYNSILVEGNKNYYLETWYRVYTEGDVAASNTSISYSGSNVSGNLVVQVIGARGALTTDPIGVWSYGPTINPDSAKPAPSISTGTGALLVLGMIGTSENVPTGGTWSSVPAMTHSINMHVSAGSFDKLHFVQGFTESRPSGGNSGDRYVTYSGTNATANQPNFMFSINRTNSAPSVPTNLAPSGTTGKNAQTLSATYSDPNGDSGLVEFQTATDSGFTANLVTHVGSTVSSGSTSTKAYTFAQNTTYYLRARSKDSFGVYSGYTASQTFTTNRPPAAATVTAPNGGEVWNASHTITWTGGSDPDGQTTTVDIELSTNGGTNWSVIVSGTANDGSHVYDFSAVAASTACKIRIRAKDTLGYYGSYDQSDANFTIQHNQAPNAPSLISPPNGGSVDLAAGYSFDWTHNDPDASDEQTAFYLRRKVEGAGSYEYWNAGTGAWQTTEVKNPSATDSYTFAGGKWDNGFTYNWSVATEDGQGVKGVYATDFTAIASAGATVSVTTPDATVTNTSQPIVSWSLSDPENDPQQTYQVVVFTLAQTAVTGFDPAASANTWTTGEVTNETDRNRQILVDLVNGTTYRAYVRVKTNAQYSAWVYREFALSLTPPAQPTLTASYEPENNRTQLVVAGQHDTVAFPVAYYVIEFSDDGGASWSTVRDAGNLPGNSAETQVAYDYEGLSQRERLYRARTVATV
jgi:hypothetical protein